MITIPELKQDIARLHAELASLDAKLDDHVSVPAEWSARTKRRVAEMLDYIARNTGKMGRHYKPTTAPATATTPLVPPQKP